MPTKMPRSFGYNSDANVAIIFALSLIPATFLVGMALDFSSAIQRRASLNAAADAAALAAVTPSMLTQSNAAAQTSAQNIFNAESSATGGVVNSSPIVTVTTSSSGLTRTAVVSYTASSVNNFPGILGQSNWPISGSSTATATAAPNINFYLLLDNSPSMNLPATSAGITAMITATQNAPASGANANGCAFACHESNPAGDNLGNPGNEDNYALAQTLGVVTRMQNLNSATQELMSTATTMEVANNVTYQMAIYTFNSSGINALQTLTSNLTAAATAAQGINVLEVYDNNYLTSRDDNDDTDTDFDTAMQQINNIMPPPGTGSGTSTPQEVLFLVTDGVEDKISTSCSQPLSGNRCQQPFDTVWCTTMKNRGIFIAVLYTEYLPLPASGIGSNSWYNTWVAPFQSQIGPNLQSCASPNLFFQVTTDGDITAAMNALFQKAVATARLSQ
jgi:Flp pilus assembly protein TadG